MRFYCATHSACGINADGSRVDFPPLPDSVDAGFKTAISAGPGSEGTLVDDAVSSSPTPPSSGTVSMIGDAEENKFMDAPAQPLEANMHIVA